MVEFEQLCRERGLGASRQRMAVAAALANSSDHPSAAELHRRARAIEPGVSTATLYRSLALFEEMGLVQRHEFAGRGARYEPAGRAGHLHLLDLKSKRLVEFDDTGLEPLLHNLCSRLGYRLVNFRIALMGTPRGGTPADDNS